MTGWRNRGVLAAIGAAVLFGASTPIAKLLLGPVSPWLLAGLLYLGSGIGLTILRGLRRTTRVRLAAGEAKWLAGAIFAGGIAAPVLLMWGLARLPASTASLLLNAEGVATALLAWFMFRENFDRRIALGMLLIVAGVVNVSIAVMLGTSAPRPEIMAGAGVLGFFSYGLSLVLFVVALRHLGTARTGAYFSMAPFVGALIAVPLFHETVTSTLLFGGLLMAAGVWLHLTERHEHPHTHARLEHEHEHVHDEHHQHDHRGAVTEPHTHRHRHDGLTHTHPHYPDAHHRHEH